MHRLAAYLGLPVSPRNLATIPSISIKSSHYLRSVRAHSHRIQQNMTLEESKPPNVLIFGTGSIGAVYAYFFLEAGCDVTAVCCSNFDTVKASGFRISSPVYGSDIRIRPRVVRDCTEATTNNQIYDYLVVCTKADPSPHAPSFIAPAVCKGRTMIALIQNGIDIEQEYAKTFPENLLLSCVAYLPVNQVSPGQVRTGKISKLEMGAYPASGNADAQARKRSEKLIQILTMVQSDVRWYDDVQQQRWLKLLTNAAWNPICALTLSRDVDVFSASDAAETAVAGVMSEVAAVARRLGYEKITEEVVQAELGKTRQRLGSKGIEPSMLIDVLNGRQLEVEAILGNPVRVARRLGESVPRLELLYTLSKALDRSIKSRKDDL